jgi:uncharacterized protein YpmB
MITFIIVLGVIIIFIVLIIAVITTNKAYGFKHTVDPHNNKPHIKEKENIGSESLLDERKDEF